VIYTVANVQEKGCTASGIQDGECARKKKIKAGEHKKAMRVVYTVVNVPEKGWDGEWYNNGERARK
jgi:hypothetical protein